MFGFRKICQNGMSLGSVMNGIKEVTYHIGKEKNIQIIREVTHQFINNVISSSSVLQEYVNNSIKDSIAYQEVLTVMNRYLKISKHRNEIAELLGFSVIEIYDKATKKHTFQYMPERITEKNLSRWELYNAITSYASHNDLNYQVETNLQEAAQKILKNSYEKLLVVSN
jgi:predicted regulator of amino acid metabolism with ACT domain